MPAPYEDRILLLFFCAVAAGLLLLYSKILSKSDVDNLCGPQSHSWILGNLAQYESSEVGSCEAAWTKEFGSTFRIDGGFGEKIIFTSDPKAMQYVLQTSSSTFLRHETTRANAEFLFGKGLLAVLGDDHKRHRKVMQPAFAVGETRALTRIFQSKATKLVQAWSELLKGGDETSVTIDVHAWLGRATLDAIGEAAFDYDFGALEQKNNPLAQNFNGLLLSVMHISLHKRIALQNILQRLPYWVRQLSALLPTHGNKRRAHNYKLSSEVAKELIHAKQKVLGTDLAQRDVMSLLVKSNASENERERLSQKKMIAQMNTIVFAGHETTANLLAWTLFELAKHPDVQRRLREEIRHWSRLAQENATGHIHVSDFEKMEYTTSVIKESLRLNSVIPRLLRIAANEDVIPLSDPVIGLDGRLIESIRVKRGMTVMTSVVHYNRRKELWGQDADCFRPERWVDDKDINSNIKFGVYGNLGSFGAGPSACIGWRFAVYEAQSFLIEMLDKFEFVQAEATKLVRHKFALVMVPSLEGDGARTCMPLTISTVE